MSKKTHRLQSATTELDPGTAKERSHRAKIAALEARIRTLEARLKKRDPLHGLPSDLQALHDRFTTTLHALNEAAHPLRSQPIEAQRSYSHADSTVDEGASTRWARTLLNKLANNVKSVVSEYEARVAGTWKPPDRAEKVRCMNRTCTAYGQRIPRHIGPNQTIELASCPACLHKLYAG